MRSNNTLEKWEEKTINDVAEICLGLTHTPKYVDKGVPFLSVKNISSGNIDFDDTKFISREEFDSLPNGAKPKKGDVLFARVGTLGCPSIVNTDVEFGTFVSLGYFRPKKSQVLNTYLRYWMLSPLFWKQVELNVQGSTLKNLNTGWLKYFKIPLPSLPEQERIVAKLDEAFEAIDKVKANAEQNLTNAKELFESHLKKYFEISHNTWNQYKLSDITTKIGSGATPLGGKKSYIASGVSLIRSMNVHDREFIYEGLAHINEKQAKQLDVVTVQEYDVLLNITGASVARCCVVPNNIIPARVNQHVSIIRPKKDLITPKFLCYLLTSNYYKSKLLKDGEEGGSTRQALTKTGLEQFKVYIPSISEQQKIVEKLDALQKQTKQLEQIYTQKIKECDELKQSILQKAFRGEL